MKPKTDRKRQDKLSRRLLDWYRLNHRDLPWRQTKNPYTVWMSEIILQQTRVAQGTSYYLNFSQTYETVRDFATAPLDDILKMWQGLGYYSRARNMHKCAGHIVEKLEGEFPNTYDQLIKLTGIGKYTAGAIASICFDQAVPAIDGNAFRVYSRVFGIYEDITLSSTFKTFFELGSQIIPHDQPGDFNQAVMELGATICLPKNPQCNSCPLEAMCYAREKKEQTSLPVKTKKTKVKSRYLDYILLHQEGQVLVKQREKGDIWQGLFDFLLIESDMHSKSSIFELVEQNDWGTPSVLYSSAEYKHLLTHQKLHLYFHVLDIPKREDFKLICQNNKLKSLHISDLVNLAVPKPIEKFLEAELPNVLNFQSLKP
ncbi:A/G-specific adenine glycosylase [Reichenbachiella agariperforans]|uniref:A/G-specific adenine glycosylase n=1 Tax=Reichenbachiella agariperforans TaxID=156994 RepID=UPI001C097D60|nr:A/G-specific adenine glycosylase [Reichenbachiella agariperforans]MBU2915975.1 A/G-specific adenine glycosylase [Reichenbachiella agariperforans]